MKQLFYTRSVCILSYYPFFQSFRECLKEIYRLANSPGVIPIERYIINLCCETPMPVAKQRCVSLTLAHKPITFRLPDENECHLLDLDLERIFSCLDINNVILMFRALISQNFKIVVSSAHISLITSVMEGLVSFLMPFEWQFTYVPVLPYSVFGILEAPLSVLVGMHSSRLRPELYRDEVCFVLFYCVFVVSFVSFVLLFLLFFCLLYNVFVLFLFILFSFVLQKEIVICDLDSNSVHVPGSVQLIDIPSNLTKYLRHNLKHMANAHKVQKYDHKDMALIDSAFAAKFGDDEEVFDSSACRICFLLFWAKVFGNEYRSYLAFPDETDVGSVKDLFKVDEFIASRPKNLKKFWTDLVETQGFERFVADETYPLLEARKYQLLYFARVCKQFVDYEEIYKKKDQQDLITREMLKWAANLKRDENTNEKIVKTKSINNKDLDLPDDYKYEPLSTFPLINKEFCGKYGNPDISTIDEKEDNNNGYSLTVTGSDAATGDYKLILKSANASKIKTEKDRAVFLLKQVYGAWFAAHVACLDFKDFMATEVENIVKNTLDVLYKMPDDAKITKDVAIIPDELIFKACLVLCGKFGKDKVCVAILRFFFVF